MKAQCPQCHTILNAIQKETAYDQVCPECSATLTVPSLDYIPPRSLPPTPSTDVDLLSQIAASTAATAKHLGQIRNLIAVCLVIGLVFFVLSLILKSV
jgi:hypothetical protein